MNTSSNPKKTQLLATGKKLFWKFGFRRVTIEEICKEARVSKMTFYKFFTNKLELASTILENVFDDAMQNVYQLRDSDISPDQKLKRILQMKSEGIHGISNEFIRDLYANPDSELKTYMDLKTGIMLTEIIKVFEKGQQDGWIRKDMNVPFLFRFIMSSVEIITDEELLKLFPSSEELIMELTNLIVYGISPND